MRYVVRDSESGNYNFGMFDNYQDAFCELKQLEDEDWDDGTYKLGTYEIYDLFEDEVVY